MRGGVREARLRLGEDFAEADVEAAGGLARELEVLHLVFPDRDDRRLVEEDVRAHQHRVGEEADGDVLLAGALLLELGHPVEVAERRHVREIPGELGVLADVALDEQGAPVGVDSARDEVPRHGVDAAAELGGLVFDRDRVGVDDAEEKLLLLLGDLLRPGADGPQPVSDVKLTARLDSGQDPALSLVVVAHR